MRELSDQDIQESYNKLKSLKAISNLSKTGLKALDALFFNHRIKTKGKMGISYVEALENPTIMEHLATLATKYRKGKTSPEITYQMFCLWYGSVSQFRPAMAKYIISRYSPKVSVLDFSAGWGGRAIACMSLGIPYTGVDTNTNLQESYAKLQELEPSFSITMIWKPSEQVAFESYPYDMIFTSPPYYTMERYENMPSYSCKKEFFDVFLIPVVMRAWTGLLSPGTMALNMPRPFYDVVKDLLPPVQEILPLPKAKRNLKNTTVAQEEIFVWRKESEN